MRPHVCTFKLLFFYQHWQCLFILLHPEDIPCKHFKWESKQSEYIISYLATEYVWAIKFRIILFLLDNTALHLLFVVNDIIGKFNPRVNFKKIICNTFLTNFVDIYVFFWWYNFVYSLQYSHNFSLNFFFKGIHVYSLFRFTPHCVIHVTDILSLKTDGFKGSLNRKCALLINFLKS